MHTGCPTLRGAVRKRLDGTTLWFSALQPLTFKVSEKHNEVLKLIDRFFVDSETPFWKQAIHFGVVSVFGID